MKKIYLYILTTILLIPNIAYANINTPSENVLYQNRDYVIDQYDVNIVVNENNTFDVTETITAYFNQPKHGIIFKLPLKNELIRLDGTKSTNRAQITNISVNDNYSIFKGKNLFNIRVGSSEYTLTGKKTYVIKYRYNIGKDPLKGKDEIYYNIIGTGWDTVIGNITFTITMPKKFDASTFGFSSGISGSTDNENVKYIVDDKKIMGYYDGILKEQEALTIRGVLPEEYFVGEGYEINNLYYVFLLIPILCLIIIYLIWKKHGKDYQVIETIEFYPPNGLNSFEVGYLYKGYTNIEDTTSLLVYLASKGYIKIVDKPEDDDFEIIKLKEYDGNDLYEKKFINGLFRKKKETSNSEKYNHNNIVNPTQILNSIKLKEEDLYYKSDIVSKKDLYDSFYKVIMDIDKTFYHDYNKKEVFEKKTGKLTFLMILLIFVSAISVCLAPIFEYIEPLSIPYIVGIIGFLMLFWLVGTIRKLPKVFKLLWYIIIAIISIILMLNAIILEYTVLDFNTIVGFILGILSLIGMILLFSLRHKRTKDNSEILGKIKGFKTFLETAEKSKIETIIFENPTYFYDVLPYAYVLNVTDKWISKFETIAVEAPDWYDCSTNFNIRNFDKSINKTMNTIKYQASSSSGGSSGGSGSSSGGGSSGGGSGGSSGSSW